MNTYRLGSNGLVHAPGIVRWAVNGYRFEHDRRDTLLRVIGEGWGVPAAAAKALLSGAVPFAVEGEAVVFSVEA